MNSWKSIALSLVAVAFTLVSTSVHAATLLYYTSSPQSWVGAGQTVLVSPANGFDFDASRNFDNGVSFRINDFASNPDFWAQRWWSLDFAAPLEAELGLGPYAKATRFPFQEPHDAGLDFSGNGSGNNMLTGSFTVREARYAEDGSVIAFAADFLQHDEGWEHAWVRGSIRYRSDVPLDQVPAPAMPSLLASAAVLCALRRRVLMLATRQDSR